MKKSVVVLLVLFCLVGVVIAGSGTLEDPYTEDDFSNSYYQYNGNPYYHPGRNGFPTETSGYMSRNSYYQYPGSTAPPYYLNTLQSDSPSDILNENYGAFFVSQGNLYGVRADAQGNIIADEYKCVGACSAEHDEFSDYDFPGVYDSTVRDDSLAFALGDRGMIKTTDPAYAKHAAALSDLGVEGLDVGDDICTDEPLDPIEDADGNPVEPSTTDDTSGDSSSTDSESTTGLSEDQLENPITNPETGEPSLNVRVEAGDGEDKGKKEAEAFAKQANCLDDAQMKALAKGFSEELSNNPENVNLLDDFWNAEALKPETKQKFMKEFLANYDGLSFSGESDLKGTWGKSSDSVDFTPEGFKGPLGLPQIKEYNEAAKSRTYTSVNTGKEKTEDFQKITGISISDDGVSYIYDAGNGKSVFIAKGSDTTFDASTNELTLKDGRKAGVWGKGAITVGKDGFVDFGFDYDGTNLRTGRVKIGDNWFGSSMWPIQEPVNFPASFQKPTQPGTYNYYKEGNRLFSVDSDGVVREFKSSSLMPTKENEVPRMIGGFTSGEAGLYFASPDEGGTAINWDGKEHVGDGSSFVYDSAEKNLKIRSSSTSWFTQRQDLNEVKLEGAAVLQNSNLLMGIHPQDGGTIFREVLNQEETKPHAITTLNEGWHITPSEGGTIEIQDPEGTVYAFSGSLQAVGQAPPQPSARPVQTPPTTTPPTQDPPTTTPPVDTPPTDGGGTTDNQKIQIATQTIQSAGYSIQSRDSIVAYSGNNQQMTLPTDIPSDAAVMVSGVNCPPCKTFKNNNGLDDGYNPEKNIYVITQPGNFGGVPRFYGPSP